MYITYTWQDGDDADHLQAHPNIDIEMQVGDKVVEFRISMTLNSLAWTQAVWAFGEGGGEPG